MRHLFFAFIVIGFFSCANKNSNKEGNPKDPDVFTLAGKIKGYANSPFSLYGFYGFQVQPVDSGLTGDNGEFSIQLPEGLEPGLYRLELHSGYRQGEPASPVYLDFVFNKESIKFETSFNYLFDSLKIIQSKENKGFYEFLHKQDIHDRKMNVLGQFLFYYPEQDNIYRRISRQVKRKRSRHANFTENFIKKNQSLLFSKIICLHQDPRVPDKHPENKVMEYRRDHFFVNTDFNNRFLLRTPYLTEKVLNYISLYRNPELEEVDQEEEYIRAIDTVMKKASVNEEVFFVLAEYLVNGFESLQMHPVSEYITSQYILGGPCDVEQIPEHLLAKASDIQKLAIGMPAPVFTFTATDGKDYELSDLSSDYTLLIFWTTTCPHCTDMMPRLKTIAGEFRQVHPGYLNFLAVSIDTDREAWEKYVKEHGLDFIHNAEFKGWESSVARLYNIHATPMLFLLDRDKNIVLKPNRLRSLERYLQRHLP